MDAIDILGSILGHKRNQSGKGPDILNDIIKGGARSRTRPRAPSSGSSIPRTDEIERQARELEDMLGVANDRHSRQPTSQSPPPSTRPDSRIQRRSHLLLAATHPSADPSPKPDHQRMSKR